jgi:hypothetical protein
MIVNALAPSTWVTGGAATTLLACYGLGRLVLDRQVLHGAGHHNPGDRFAVCTTELAVILAVQGAGRLVRHLSGGRQPTEPF